MKTCSKPSSPISNCHLLGGDNISEVEVIFFGRDKPQKKQQHTKTFFGYLGYDLIGPHMVELGKWGPPR